MLINFFNSFQFVIQLKAKNPSDYFQSDWYTSFIFVWNHFVDFDFETAVSVSFVFWMFSYHLTCLSKCKLVNQLPRMVSKQQVLVLRMTF